jgi:hypothetical protein
MVVLEMLFHPRLVSCRESTEAAAPRICIACACRASHNFADSFFGRVACARRFSPSNPLVHMFVIGVLLLWCQRNTGKKQKTQLMIEVPSAWFPSAAVALLKRQLTATSPSFFNPMVKVVTLFYREINSVHLSSSNPILCRSWRGLIFFLVP